MAVIESATRDGRLAHLTASERRALAELVERLRQRYGDDLLRVALFGSKARGNFDEESDLDVLVVVKHIPDETYWQHRSEIVDHTYDLELEHDVVFSLLVLDEGEHSRMRQWNLLINRNIERDGIDLWTSQPNEPQFA
jgi:predicted nucleotidyltransferase